MSSGERAAAWRMLGLATLAVVCSMTTWFAATAILPDLERHFALGPGQAIWMTNGVQLGFVLGALALSALNLPDIAPSRPLMGFAAAAAALCNLALLAAPSAEWAIALRVLTGVALAGVYPPALKLIATWFTRGRGFAMGAIIGGLTLGSAAPHLLRALLAGVDWRWAVAAASAVTLAGAAISLGLLREGPHPFSRTVFDPRQLGRVVRNRAVALANLGYFGHMWELYAMWGWFLVFASAGWAALEGVSPAGLSLLTFVVIAAGGLGALAAGAVADRLGRTATTAAILCISGLCAGLIGVTVEGPAWLFLTVAVVWGITIVADSAQFSAMTSEVGDPDLVGTALAFQLGVGFALTMLSVQLVPMVADAIGWRYAFVVLVPGPLVGAAAMLVLRRLPEAERIAGGRR